MTPLSQEHAHLRSAAEARGWWNAAVAADPTALARPWPVLLLTGLGAWLATLPLVMFVGMIVSTVLPDRAVPYAGAVVGLALARAFQQAGKNSLFIEQLMVPALLAGVGSLAMGLFHDLPNGLAAALLTAALVGLTAVFETTWLRLLLAAGAGVAAASTFALVGTGAARMVSGFWYGWHAVAAAAMAAWFAADRAASPSQARWLESLGCGAALASVAGLAALAGMTFLFGASSGEPLRWLPHHEALSTAMRVISALAALAAAAAVLRRWPALPRIPALLAGAAMVALAVPMDTLGALLLLAAVAGTRGRPRRMAAALLGCVWVIGAFYYALSWPLIVKAAVLAAAGATWLVAATVLRQPRRGTPGAQGTADGTPRRLLPALGIALSALSVTGISGSGVWHNERLIATGKPSFLELAPVDPRSLVMGDYMALAYRMPPEVQRALDALDTDASPRLATRRDGHDVLVPQRLLAAGEAPAPDEETIVLSRQGGRWVVTSNAWFFPEGEAERWQPARYGEFRVLPDGRALLVGLRGADLAPLPPLPKATQR